MKQLYDNKSFKFILLGFVVLLISACVDDPLNDEQYTNLVTLIGTQDEVQEKKVKYGSQGDFFVSVYCGGTLPPEKDVTVSLVQAHKSNIDNYNYKNVLAGEIKYQPLPEEWYEIPSYKGVIQAGERYARIPVRILPDKIDTDSLYLISLKLLSATPYQVNEKADTVLLVKVKMINDYSGNYTMEGSEYSVNEDGTLDSLSVLPLNVSRSLTAVNKNMVRFYHKNTNEKLSELKENGIIMEVDELTGKVKVQPWDKLPIVPDSGNGTYKVEYNVYNNRTRTFSIEYRYTNNGKRMHVSLKMTSTENE